MSGRTVLIIGVVVAATVAAVGAVLGFDLLNQNATPGEERSGTRLGPAAGDGSAGTPPAASTTTPAPAAAPATPAGTIDATPGAAAPVQPQIDTSVTEPPQPSAP